MIISYDNDSMIFDMHIIIEKKYPFHIPTDENTAPFLRSTKENAS